MNAQKSLLSAAVALCTLGMLSSGCANPCQRLTEKICDCEPTISDRRACRTDRIANQGSTVEVSESQAEECTAFLETCDCQAIDDGRLDLCGFTLEGPPEFNDDAGSDATSETP